MAQAVQDSGARPDPDVAMDWMRMPVAQDQQPGMATDDELTSLARARGDELDELYSRLLIEHHAGGIGMAEVAAEQSALAGTRQLAAAMARGQTFEIGELNDARSALGLRVHDVEPVDHD